MVNSFAIQVSFWDDMFNHLKIKIVLTFEITRMFRRTRGKNLSKIVPEEVKGIKKKTLGQENTHKLCQRKINISLAVMFVILFADGFLIKLQAT